MTKVSALLFTVLTLVMQPSTANAQPPRGRPIAPPATTLIAPVGNVFGNTMAFSWQAVPEAAGYLLLLYGTLSTDGPASPPLEHISMDVFYTAEQAGCATNASLPRHGTCTVMLTPPVLANPYHWTVRTWSPGGFGPDAERLVFLVKDPVQNWGSFATAENVRFTHAFGAASPVYVDNETGLIWSQPNLGPFTATESLFVCQDQTVSNRKGFRLPKREELETLMDLGESQPTLPLGHPFAKLAPGATTFSFWTQTREVVANQTLTWYVNFFTGETNAAGSLQPDVEMGVWCVRGPGGR